MEISGEERFRVFTIERGARVTLQALTLARGSAPDGGAIVTRGRLVVKDTTLVDNSAKGTGGAILQEEGELFLVNSTLTRNRAGSEGGAVAVKSGRATVTNATFCENAAPRAGGLLAAAASTLLVRNTILANSAEGADCVRLGELDAGSTHNLIEQNEGCGTPLSTADPLLAPLGLYNGPTPTLPLASRSPALNWGDNASAVDENGERLVWDQRGNGDPRDVAGITDIGAFESQYKVDLVVDTPQDDDRCACTPSIPEDCSLRGALALANATPRLDRIRFDAAACGPSRTLVVNHPLPAVTAPLTLDASPCGGLTLRANGPFSVLPKAEGVELTLVNLTVRRAQTRDPDPAMRSQARVPPPSTIVKLDKR